MNPDDVTDADDWKRVSDLFDEARGLEPSERASFLEGACLDKPELRKVVEALLAADAQSGSTPLDRPPTVLAGIRDSFEQPFETGQRVGPYRIVREIGRGGMGVVYLADEVELSSKVALKVLLPEMTADPGRRARFRREAQAHRRLSHPAIATVFAFHDFDGMLCIASEYIDGTMLRERIDQGPLGVAETVVIGIEIAGALVEASEKGIVHRDLKPENVMCTREGRVKVLDFGLAALADTEVRPGNRATRLTREGVVVGTPSYMSPEQLQGRIVDARSDIFTVGVILYELASSKHPFETADAAMTGARILVLEPPPLASKVPGIPAAFERIVRKCLKKDLAERYQSAKDLLVDLEAMRAQPRERPKTSQAIVLDDRAHSIDARRWWRVHQLVIAAAYAIMAIAAWRAAAAGLLESDLIYAITICTAAAAGAARLHLVFVERLEGARAASRVAKVAGFVRYADWTFTALLAASALLMMPSHRLVAATVGASAVVFAYAFLVIEPGTTRKGFPRRTSGVRRKRAV